MYPNQQQQGYPQPGFATPAYGYPQQTGYPPQQPGYPQSGYGGYAAGGPSVNLNMGPPMGGNDTYGGGGGGFLADPVGMFAEKAIRNAFVNKVYSILTVQLLFTSILIGSFVLNSETKSYFKYHQGWAFIGLAIFFVTFLILVCVESARRSTPCNFILLSILTVGYGSVAAIISCRYAEDVVLYAFLATAASCFLVAALAKSSYFDITNCGTTLCLLGLFHMIIGIVLTLILVPLGYAKLATLLLSISGALLVSLYLMFDLQLIMGGRKCELSPEEYILGAIMLYTDIIQLFIYMLEIISRIKDD